jgi:hypothetical protein
MVNNINRLKPSRAICRLTFSPNQLMFWRSEPREKIGLMSKMEFINRKARVALVKTSGINFLDILPIRGRQAAITKGRKINENTTVPPLL